MAVNSSSRNCAIAQVEGLLMPIPSSEKSESQLRLRNSQAFLKGTSSGMRAVEEMIQALSQSDVPVLLLAENGAGKQTVARRIHAASRRSSREFRLIECKDLRPESLDGADGNILACPGTVYLDEIASLSPAAQLRLTEALARLEQAESKRVHGRLICGSARNLDGEARSGQ